MRPLSNPRLERVWRTDRVWYSASTSGAVTIKSSSMFCSNDQLAGFKWRPRSTNIQLYCRLRNRKRLSARHGSGGVAALLETETGDGISIGDASRSTPVATGVANSRQTLELRRRTDSKASPA